MAQPPSTTSPPRRNNPMPTPERAPRLSASQVEALRLVLDSASAAERDQLAHYIPWLATIGSDLNPIAIMLARLDRTELDLDQSELVVSSSRLSPEISRRSIGHAAPTGTPKLVPIFD